MNKSFTQILGNFIQFNSNIKLKFIKKLNLCLKFYKLNFILK